MKKKNSVSLNDIAKRLKISKMTVSLALRNNPRISKSTREKVSKVAAEMGYCPNPEVSKFMSAIRQQVSDERGTPVAYITTGIEKGMWRLSPTELEYWEGATERAKTYGYYLEEYWLDEPDMSEARLSDILWNRGINGVIIPPFVRTLSSEELAPKLNFKWPYFASVAISDMLASPLLNRVVHDHYTSMITVMDKFCELGHSRIGLALSEHMDYTVNRRWQAGYRVYRANHPIHRVEPMIAEHLDPGSIGKWIKKNRLDAIIGADHRMVKMIEESGFAVGKEIAYADLDIAQEKNSQKNVSGIIQNSKMIGMAGIDLLISAIQRNETGIPEIPMVLQVEGTWKQGSTTPIKKSVRKSKKS